MISGKTGGLKARPHPVEDTHKADTLTNDSLQHVFHFLALSLTLSLLYHTHHTHTHTHTHVSLSASHRRALPTDQTHFFIYIKVCFTSFPQTFFKLF